MYKRLLNRWPKLLANRRADASACDHLASDYSDYTMTILYHIRRLTNDDMWTRTNTSMAESEIETLKKLRALALEGIKHVGSEIASDSVFADTPPPKVAKPTASTMKQVRDHDDSDEVPDADWTNLVEMLDPTKLATSMPAKHTPETPNRLQKVLHRITIKGIE